VVVAEVADGSEGAHVDRVEPVDVARVQDQAKRPHVPDGAHQGAAQLDRVVGVERAVRVDDQAARRAAQPAA
jgi:hypothetical protein